MLRRKKASIHTGSSAEEDIAEAMGLHSYLLRSRLNWILYFIMSISILSAYLAVNIHFYPGYPVTTHFAEKDTLYEEHYPPFRMNEWTCYRITDEIIHGRLYEANSFSRLHPIGFSLLAVPFTIRWGEAGPYFTNAVILWLSALIFFLMMREITGALTAAAATLVLAFATPNFFYAASAFSEPTAQLLVVLAMFLFVRGLSSAPEWLYFTGAGICAGLLLFVQPPMALLGILLIVARLYENGRWGWFEKSAFALAGGFALSAAAFFTVNYLKLNSPVQFLFSTPYCPYNLLSRNIYGENPHFMLGVWQLLFDSPHGLVFIMPFAILVPTGYLAMWRNENRELSLVAGCMALYIIIMAAASACPVTGESLGSRHLVALMPFFVMPVALMWEESRGERIIAGVLVLLTIYMSTFGWWTASANPNAFFRGVLEDRGARLILLARKGKLDRPVFTSRNELIDRYFDSLDAGDIKTWLQTLDPASIEEIRGFEREFFSILVKRSKETDIDRSEFIQSADPDRGVMPVIPNLLDELPPDNPSYLDVQ